MSTTILTRTAAAGIALGLLLTATACGTDQATDNTPGGAPVAAASHARSSGAHTAISADAAERNAAQPPAISADSAERQGQQHVLHLRRQ